MKKLHFLALPALVHLCGCASTPDPENGAVPQAVLEAFERDFGAVKATWEEEGSFYVGEFELNNVVQEAFYDEQGALVGRSYDGASLPLPAIRALSAIMPEGKVQGVEAITSDDSVIHYEVEVASGGRIHHVPLDAAGSILGQEVEEEEAGELEDPQDSATEPMIEA